MGLARIFDAISCGWRLFWYMDAKWAAALSAASFPSSEATISHANFFLASIIQRAFPERIDALFGPAYKGIPLAAATAMTLAISFKRQVGFCFNRKESKGHGEGGKLIGHRLRENETVVIIEDVTTAGTSIRESVPLLLETASIKILGLVVSVDRMERGATSKSALAQLREEFGIRTSAIVNLDEIMEYLHNRQIDGKVVLDDALYEKIMKYRSTYSAASY